MNDEQFVKAVKTEKYYLQFNADPAYSKIMLLDEEGKNAGKLNFDVAYMPSHSLNSFCFGCRYLH